MKSSIFPDIVRLAVTAALLVVFALPAAAQGPKTLNYPTVEVLHTLDIHPTPLPYGVPFVVKSAWPSKVNCVEVRVFELGSSTPLSVEPQFRAVTDKDKPGFKSHFTVTVDRLKPSRRHSIRFSFFENGLAHARDRCRQSVGAAGTHTEVSARTRATFLSHFDSDFGMIYAFDPSSDEKLGTVGLAAGIHMYFYPIHPDTDLDEYPYPTFRRLSLTAGVVAHRLSSTAAVPIKNATSFGSVYVGLGWRGVLYPIGPPVLRRLLQPLRLNAGLMYFKQADANPLVTREHLKASPYVGLALDNSVSGILGSLKSLFGL